MPVAPSSRRTEAGAREHRHRPQFGSRQLEVPMNQLGNLLYLRSHEAELELIATR